MQITFLVLKLMCVFLPAAQASERPSFYRGVRELGMGGAAVATVNDETALLENPAALAKLRDNFVTPVDPEAEIGASTYGAAGNDTARLNDPQRALNDALKKPDRNLHERVQVSPSVVVPGFGLGVFGKYEVNARLNQATNLFEYHSTNDYAASLGAATRLVGGLVKVGANARLVNRAEVARDDLDPTQNNLSLNELQRRGLGLASDVGLHATLPVAWLPSIAAVYRDIGQTAFTREGGIFKRTETAPAAVRQSVDVGLAIAPIWSAHVRTTWSLEYDGVDSAGAERDQMSRVHLGAELNFGDALFLRAGMNQRYWTAGLEMAVGLYQFQVASYGEEIGTLDMPREDRRYAFKFALRF